jgi:hypothetical protein
VRKILKTVYVKSEDISMIENDINARPYYMIYSNAEKGTEEVELTLSLSEVYTVTESVLDEILDDLIVAADDRTAYQKREQVKSILRQASK